MRVLCLPADDTGCGWFRIQWAAQHLAAQGHDVRVMPPSERRLPVVTDGWNVVDVQLEDVDVVVLQRVTHPVMADAVQVLRDKGIAVVIDVDDDLTSIHPRNPVYPTLHPRNAAAKDRELRALEAQGRLRGPDLARHRPHSWHDLTRACRAATLVTVSTPALLKTYAAHGRGVVLPNVLPDAYFTQQRTDSAVIGWPASIQTHPDDPTVTGGAVARLVEEGASFRVVANSTGTGAPFGLRQDPPGMPPIPLDQWPAAVAALGIGVAPLTDTRFNAAKSWLKPLEMAALGVPVVMSPRVEYARLHDLGVGVLADTSRRWYRELKRLVDSEAARRELGESGRAAVDDLRVERQSWRWMDAWKTAVEIQHDRYRTVSVPA